LYFYALHRHRDATHALLAAGARSMAKQLHRRGL